MKEKAAIIFSIVVWGVMLLFLTRSMTRLPTRAEWGTLFQNGGQEAMLAFGALFFAALVLRGVRFGHLIRKASSIRWGTIAWAFPWLFMAGAITPFRMGETARAGWVRYHGGSGSHTIGLWVAERATDMLILVFLGLLSLALAPGLEYLRSPFLLLGVLLVIGYAALSFGQNIAQRAVQRLPVGREIASTMLGGLSYMRDPRPHGTVFLLSCLIWGAMTAAFWSGLTLILGCPVPVSMAILCMVAVNLAAILSAAPANIGSFQAAGLAVLVTYDIDTITAVLATTALQAAGLMVTLVLGMICLGLSAIRRHFSLT